MSKKNKRYWMDIGYSEESSIILAKNERDILNPSKNYIWDFLQLPKPHIIPKMSFKSKKFWEEIGYDDHIIKDILKNIKEICYPYHKNYWLIRGYSEDESKNKSSSQRLDKCSLSKNYIIKNNGSKYYEMVKHKDYRKIKYNTKEYWMNKGYSEVDSVNLVRDSVKRASKRCIEHWMNKGYSVEESANLVKTFQDRSSINYFLQVCNNDNAIAVSLYEQRCELNKISSTRRKEYWINKGYSEDDAIKQVSLTQRKNFNKSKLSRVYWMNKGYSEKEAIMESKKYAQEKSCLCEVFWRNRGYSEEESIQKIIKLQSINGKLAVNKCKEVKSSRLEDEIFDTLMKKYDVIYRHFIFEDLENNKIYIPDFYLPESNTIIEVYGDYWHMNPKIYNEEHNVCGLSFSYIHDRDRKRKQFFEKKYNFKILWENDIKEGNIEI
jgi:hypothetical protein